MKKKLSLLTLLIVVTIIACKKNEPLSDAADNYSPTPVLPENPDNYAASSNDRLATLGRVLFYDKSLSMNNSVACANCHQQSKAFCDNLQFSVGLEDRNTARNTPSIFAKQGRMFWDGRANSMQDLVLRPIKNHIEMKFDNLDALAKKIAQIDYYPALFAKAFGTTFIDSSRIKSAISEFLRNFNFSNNKFSRVGKHIETLNASETVGKMIFFGKGKCSGCHHIENDNISGPIFGNDSNNVGGGYGFTDFAFNIGLDKVYKDQGIGGITGDPESVGTFMVPVLLNVEYTSPYMHDGRFKTLEEVVEHYNSGIQDHPNLDIALRDLSKFGNRPEEEIFMTLDANHNNMIDPSELSAIPPMRLNLTQSEKKCLVDFLKTLSDPTILIDKKFKSPFVKS